MPNHRSRNEQIRQQLIDITRDSVANLDNPSALRGAVENQQLSIKTLKTLLWSVTALCFSAALFMFSACALIDRCVKYSISISQNQAEQRSKPQPESLVKITQRTRGVTRG